MPILRAISIRQPFVELILQGKKTEEYRSRRTHIRERVYIYASHTPSDHTASWRKLHASPGSLPTGVIVGTVAVIDCVDYGDAFGYVLAEPRRLNRYKLPINQPQPGFWRPRFG